MLGDQLLGLDNYLPITLPSDHGDQWLGYLSHPDAEPYLGNLPFDRWWRCWLGLNATAWSWLQAWAPPDRSDAADASERERLRLCAEAHNLGMIEVDLARLRRDVLGQRVPYTASEEDYDAFVDSLTWRPGATKPEFIESPTVFYPSGTDTMYWDLLQQPDLAQHAAGKAMPLGGHQRPIGRGEPTLSPPSCRSRTVIWWRKRQDLHVLAPGRSSAATAAGRTRWSRHSPKNESWHGTALQIDARQ